MAESDIDLLKFYRSEIQFQSSLLAGRLNAFISSQSFLVIAYAMTASSLIGQWQAPFTLLFPPFLALLGLTLALQAWPGIKAAYVVLGEWEQRQDELLAVSRELKKYDLHAAERSPESQHSGIAWKHFRQGALFPRYAPWLFSTAWCFFASLPVVLFFTH
ncbi:hypothetical protein MHM84_09890 [Halomonas sp. McH1-25]|uniref:hypothetical protein n=1 Tax=unclassified Halomonas TaxID=2609666 RepID=UPI001EF527AE|nr:MULTISPECIES: hypothetical protein [unclassified Halomonas]MCG7600099.1 hypothetical protein [Halomonas sp. McH1-25]MCP1341348.1 hypothetical protein [Halomonas sp. FL8]MCP1359707.1 hypothetical protein [Halomonas sp. BBD45]MCP1366625.1 hypothetical protein [Halomonas sp. BBD48]